MKSFTVIVNYNSADRHDHMRLTLVVASPRYMQMPHPYLQRLQVVRHDIVGAALQTNDTDRRELCCRSDYDSTYVVLVWSVMSVMTSLWLCEIRRKEETRQRKMSSCITTSISSCIPLGPPTSNIDLTPVLLDSLDAFIERQPLDDSFSEAGISLASRISASGDVKL